MTNKTIRGARMFRVWRDVQATEGHMRGGEFVITFIPKLVGEGEAFHEYRIKNLGEGDFYFKLNLEGFNLECNRPYTTLSNAKRGVERAMERLGLRVEWYKEGEE